jgi:hypothetical protein
MSVVSDEQILKGYYITFFGKCEDFKELRKSSKTAVIAAYPQGVSPSIHPSIYQAI